MIPRRHRNVLLPSLLTDSSDSVSPARGGQALPLAGRSPLWRCGMLPVLYEPRTQVPFTPVGYSLSLPFAPPENALVSACGAPPLFLLAGGTRRLHAMIHSALICQYFQFVQSALFSATGSLHPFDSQKEQAICSLERMNLNSPPLR